MDLGQFARNRRMLFAWILVPVLLAALLLFVTNLYARAVDEALVGVRSHHAVIPSMQYQLHLADKTLAQFASGTASESTSLDRLSALLYEAGARADFDVQSVKIDVATPSPREGFRGLRIAVLGQGSLVAAVRYIDDLQATRRLIEVESANINRKESTGAFPEYSARLVFVHYSFPRVRTGAGDQAATE